jgi:hypothetical protein
MNIAQAWINITFWQLVGSMMGRWAVIVVALFCVVLFYKMIFNNITSMLSDALLYY